MDQENPKAIQAGAPGAPVEAKITQAIVQIGAKSVEARVITAAEFAIALGLALNIFAQMVAENSDADIDVVMRALRENFDQGFAANVCRADQVAEVAVPASAAAANDAQANPAVQPAHNIDLAAFEPPSTMLH